jgi:translation initiation factor 4A
MDLPHALPHALPKDDYKPENLIQAWDQMDLKDDLLRGIFAYGFDTPSEIQKKAILPLISGKDLIAQAQSGSGKTGTFVIGTLQRIDISLNKTQALILAPTHELVKQTATVFQSLGNMLGQGSKSGALRVKTMIGGTSIREDVQELKQTIPHVVVGTVGRVFDMITKGHLAIKDLKIFILDEADEMLSRGFGDQIKQMFQNYFSADIQVALFSATLPPEIIRISEQFMISPNKIMMKPPELNLKCIQQFYVAVQDDSMKFEVLKDLFSVISTSKCIIYCNSVNRVKELHFYMEKEGFSVCNIHSSMEKTEREQVFFQFRHGDHRVLISSDITARGIDIQQVSTVINFDIPRCVHTYLHRIGRSGRWGRKGFAINFVTKTDIVEMRKIEAHYDISIQELPNTFNGIV